MTQVSCFKVQVFLHVKVLCAVFDPCPMSSGLLHNNNSSWLANLTPLVDRIPLLLRRGTLRLPNDPRVPVIMIGPGTGVAPMRSLLQQRAAMLASPPNPQTPVDGAGRADAAAIALGSCALIFGCRNPGQDWLYHDEFEALQVLFRVILHHSHFDDPTSFRACITRSRRENRDWTFLRLLSA